MSGNSKQRKQARRFSIRFLRNLRDVLNQTVRPMIKEEREKEFQDMMKGMDDLMVDALRPHRQSSEATGF